MAEDQLARVLEKNTELTIKNTNLQKQVQQLQNVKSVGSTDCADKLESVLKQMREATDRRKEIEKEHSDTLALLKEKQSDIQRKVSTTSEKSKAYESIETLQSKIRELEKKAELQNVLHEELVLEMAAIKRSAKAGNTTSWNKHSHDAHISPESSICTPEMTCMDQTTMTGTCNSLDNHIEHRPILKNRSQYTVASSGTVLHSAPLTDAMHVHTQSNIGSEIDSIMEKIDQDNKVLAELDKTRFTIGRTPIGGRQLPLQPKINTTSLASHISSTGTVQSTNLPLSGIPNMQDALNRHNITGNLTTDNVGNFLVTNTGVSILPQTAQSTLPLNLAQNPICNPMGAQYQPFILSSGPNATAHIRNQPPMILQQTHPQPRLMPQLPNIVPSQYDLDRIYGAFPDQHITVSQDPKIVDMLDIPGKGRCYVYIARYSYDPFQQSPNECPESELAVNAGDYILVWGNMDEDGFYDAELLDGRRGLVPSNFVQKLIGDDLLDFHQSVIQGLRDCDDSASTNIPQDFDYHMNSGEFCSKKMGEYDFLDLLDDEADEEEAEHSSEGPVAAPKQLTLERQLNKSILIGWNPPDLSSSPPIDCYHVYVDRVLKVTVKSTERTRALVEGVDSNRPHRISVRSVTLNRRTSRDAACTMVIGKDVPLGPTNVKASRVTATSAVISWLPSNSNYQHVVCVNNVELRTVKPGVYRHTITGLAPNTVYRVTVRAKNIRAPHFDEKSNIAMERYSCHIDFRTLPKDREPEMPNYNCLPEPPVDIQVEPGPQDGTLLVTWQPPNASSSGSCSIITGYAVYADGKKVTDVDSPSGDHALIDINKLLGLNPKQVTVRTKSRDSQSSDSIPTQIPSHILKDKHHNEKQEEERRRYGSSGPSHLRHQHRSSQIMDSEENLSDKEMYPNNNISIPAIEITKDTGSEGNYSEDDYMDRRGVGRPHYEPRGSNVRGRSHHMQQQQQQQQPRHHRRDERDQFYTDRGDGRGTRERDRPVYRGSRLPHSGPHQQGTREKRPRWFVALFDYDPTTMSPNPDACEEELPFSEGDTIKVFGEKDADGFYWGECRGRRGFVPHNMVVEVQGMDGGVQGTSKDRNRDRDRWGDIYANMPVKKMIAMYDYDPQELSPNVDAEVELSFQTGNIIYVYGEMDDDGFYMGELEGVRGLVPSNFLTEAEPGKRSSRQGDRGHGPGARGPPPPPRPDPRSDRRKDACPVTSQVDHRQDGRVEKETMHTTSHLSTARKYQAPPNPVPQLPPSIETKQPTNATPATESLAPNLMQKLSEMTAGDNSVDHILSKGKELIFMKFGLGK